MVSSKLIPSLFLITMVFAGCSPGTSDNLNSIREDPSVGGSSEESGAEINFNEATATISIPATLTPENVSSKIVPEPIVMPITVYIVDSDDEQLSSRREVNQLESIYEKVNGIWASAGITIQVQAIQRITIPDSVLQSILIGDFQPFRASIGREFDVPDPSLLNSFYTREIGGPNGIVPFDARLFFVADEPSVHDERVTSHEIGHILGLHHTLVDEGRLMFPGTNGMSLTDEELTVARYTAQGILDGFR